MIDFKALIEKIQIKPMASRPNTTLGDSLNVDYLELIEESLAHSKKLWDKEIYLRGFSAKHTGLLLYVKNERNGFYGMIDDKASKLMKALKIKNPTFATRQELKAKMFGNVYYFVPMGKFDSWQSPAHHDIVAGFRDTDVEPEEVAKTYKRSLDRINDSETVFDCKEYMLVHRNVIDYCRKSKFCNLTDIQTYGDLYKVLKAMKNRVEWERKK